MKKMISLVMCLVMVLCMIPAPAMAVPTIDSVKIGGVGIWSDGTMYAYVSGTNASGSDIIAATTTALSDNYVKWDGNNTLTLHNFQATFTDVDYGIYISSSDSTTIVVEGDNVVSYTNVTCQNGSGIHYGTTNGCLTIKGDGSLTIVASAMDAGKNAVGIDSLGSVAIYGKTMFNISAYSAQQSASGIYANSNVTISGGTFTISATGNKPAYGIYANSNVTISDGTFTNISATSNSFSANGISASNMVISGGTFNSIFASGTSYGCLYSSNSTTSVSSTSLSVKYGDDASCKNYLPAASYTDVPNNLGCKYMIIQPTVAEILDASGNPLYYVGEWNDAIKVCKKDSSSSTIKMLTNISLPYNFQVKTGIGEINAVTLDLNNCVLNGNNHCIANQGILKITDSSNRDRVHIWVASNTGLWEIQDNYDTTGKKENVDYYKTAGGCITNLKADKNQSLNIDYGTILNWGSLTISNVNLIGNYGGMGGTLYNYQRQGSNSYGIATLTNCNVMGNIANLAGGIANSGYLTVKNCKIAYNTGIVEVGGIYNNGDLILENSEVTNNVTNSYRASKIPENDKKNYPSAGVYSYKNNSTDITKVTLIGKVVVEDNKTAAKERSSEILESGAEFINANFIVAGSDITVNAQKLSSDSKIGVSKLTASKSDIGDDNPTFGEIVTACSENISNCFFADNEKNIVYYEAGAIVLVTATNVVFDSVGGSEVESKKIVSGTVVEEPDDPTKSGYTFDGWYTDAACKNKFNFNTPIVTDTTLYAKWTLIPVYGNGGYYASTGITITSDLKNITKVTVDGVAVNAQNYTVSDGNVVLKNTYLSTLSNGKHTVKLYNGDTVATATINVTNGVVKSVRTGDAGILLYSGLAISSLLGMGYVAKKKEF